MNFRSTIRHNLPKRSALALALATTHVMGAEPITNSLLDLNLDQLMQLEVSVTAISSRAQDLSTAAAAVYVITADEISRASARNIPDLLRFVPGLEVAELDGNKWAVTARGFNGRISNKIMVLVDRRIVYSPSFAAVFWESEDLPLSLIERIEVIRGPGATIWGANAVNGVVSITTKAATKDSHVSMLAGNQERGIVEGSVGMAVGSTGNLRLHGKYRDRNDSDTLQGPSANDDWQASRFGFRYDGMLSSIDTLTFQGDYYHQNIDQNYIRNLLNPQGSILQDQVNQQGGNVLGRWDHSYASGASLTTQVYYDQRKRDEYSLNEDARTWDIDVKWHNSSASQHSITIGTGARSTRHSTNNTRLLKFFPPVDNLDIYNLAFNDDYKWTAKTRLGLSTKAEYNIYTGIEYQGSLKISQELNAKNFIWSAVTKAVRTPSRTERDGTYFLASLPAGTVPQVPAPLVLQLEPSARLQAEDMSSFELGWRFVPTPSFTLDVNAYSNHYWNQRGVEFLTPYCSPSPLCYPVLEKLVQPAVVGNTDDAKSYGVEIQARSQLSPSFFMEVGASYNSVHYHSTVKFPATFASTGNLLAALRPGGSAPNYKSNVQLLWKIDTDSNFRIGYRFVSSQQELQIDSYHALDLSYRHSISKNWTLSLAARNLGGKHVEFLDYIIPTSPALVGPSYYLQLDWQW